MKKLEMPEAMPSRQESVPGPVTEQKKKAAVLARRALEEFRAKREAEDREEMNEELDMLEPKAYEEEQVAKTVARMADRDVSESRKRKRKQETELQGMVKELVDESGVEVPAMKEEAPAEKSGTELRKEMEELDKEWAERIKRDIEETEAKTAELQKKNIAKAEKMQSVREKNRAALEHYKEEVLPKQERAEAVEEITAGIRAERKAAEADPLRSRSMARLKKLEGEHFKIGQELRDVTGMDPDEAYEKLVLNAGFMGRIRRGLASLANVPTYKLLDQWLETGKKVEAAQNEVVGIKASAEQSFKARGKRQMVNVEEAAAEATDREFMKENPEVAAIEEDYKKGVVRDAEGAVIDDEKKIRAKRPMSRVPGRKVSMGTSGISDSMSRAEPVRLYQPEGASREMPKAANTEQESVTLEYQKERAADINTVRKEYPRAAELWNSIAARMQGMEQDQLDALQEVFGTRDLATAYVLDRAFYDMDGDQEAKARIAQADKIMGIEEVSPKKVRPKLVKKAA